MSQQTLVPDVKVAPDRGPKVKPRKPSWRERHPVVGQWARGRNAVIGIPYVWLLVFFMLPFLIVLKISISEVDGRGWPASMTVVETVQPV